MAEQVSNIPFPAKLELRKGNLGENWKKFSRVWTNYEVATGLSEKDMKVRVATLLTCMGPDAIELCETFTLSADDRKDCVKVIQAFEKYCIGETNETYERYMFNCRCQEANETIDAYASVLRTLVKTCNYGDLENSMLRDRIVIGIRDNRTRKRLLQEKKLAFSKCMDMCRASEKTDERARTMNQEEVSAVNRFPTKDTEKTEKTAMIRDCWYCGKKHSPKKEACPAWGKTCTKCGAMNHFAVKCKNKSQTHENRNMKHKSMKAKGVHTVNLETEYSDSEDGDVLVIEEIQMVDSEHYQKKLFARMKIENEQFKCQLDCGATVNIMSDTDYMKIYDDPFLTGLHKCKITLKMYNKSETKALGKRQFKVTNLKNKKMYNLEFVVVKGSAQMLLGSQAIQSMNLITVNREHIMSVEMPETIINMFEDIFVGEGKLPGKLHLELTENPKPVQQPVRRVPIAVKPKLKKELERLEKLGMIVPVKEPTDWISSMVVVMKSSGKVRLCIDPKPLNKCLKRNIYPIPTIEDILPELTKAKVFSVVDAKNGFWQVQLDEESSYLTTFGTPWGRFRWLRMPFGISPAPEEFQRRLDEALESLEGIKALHDDILVWGCGQTHEEAVQDHDQKLRSLFERCRTKNIRLNKDKLKLRQKEVVFMGHVIGEGGLKVDESKIEAIKNMPTPTDKKGVQRLLGMVNYVQKFAPRLSSVTEPLRQLIRKDTEFVWDRTHEECVKEVQAILSSVPVLKFFDVDKQTVLQCDASETGLGACLIQEGHPVAYASRALTAAEKNYAQIEKELLAIVFGAEKYEHYVYGRKVIVESDHKPLEIIHKKCLTSAPKRLQRMLLRLQKFDIDIQYKPGPQMHMADALSRAYLPSQNDNRSYTETEVESVNMVEMLPVSEERVQEIRQNTTDDQQLQLLKRTVMVGWPEKREDVDQDIQCYFPFREEISLQHGLLFKGDRVIIPRHMQVSIMDRLHSSHIGIQGCLRRAREAVYWPKMYTDIEQYIQKCDTCRELSMHQQKETLHSHEIPSRPWEVIGVDLCECNGENYLITVDYLSNFFEVDRLCSTSAKGVVPKLKKHMARYGIPDKVVSDNGPPFFGKEFKEFAKTYEFKHVTSSPLYPRSNGKVENAVKTAKRLMKKAKHSESDAHLALLDYRNTPTEGVGLSPAQVMFGRRTRTLLPMAKRLLMPEDKSRDDHYQKLLKNKEKQAKYYNKNAKDIEPLKPGDIVRVSPLAKNQPWRKAKVEAEEGIRSYRIQTEDGSSFRRNQLHLRATTEPFREETIDSRIEQNETRVLNSFSESCVLGEGEVKSPSAQCLGELKSPRAQKQLSIESKEKSDSSKTGNMNGRESSVRLFDKNNITDYRTTSGRTIKKPAYLQEYHT